MEIEILDYSHGPEGVRVGVVTLDGDKVAVRSQNEIVKDMVLNDVWMYQGKRFTSKDGAAFMEILPKVLAGSRLRAEVVK
jgi:hypothetical protein